MRRVEPVYHVLLGEYDPSTPAGDRDSFDSQVCTAANEKGEKVTYGVNVGGGA